MNMAKYRAAQARRKRRELAQRREYMADFDLSAHAPDTLALIEDGSIEICPICRGLSAYAWQDASEDGGPIAHIGAASGLGEWQCGHCRAYLVAADSILTANVFTHCDD